MKRLRRTGAVVFWLAMLGWLMRYEAFPEYFTHAMAGYRSLVQGDVLMKDSWMRILVKGQPVGYSRTSIETRETDPAEYYTVTSIMRMRMALPGGEQTINVQTVASLDMMQQLQRFSFEMSAADYKADVVGRRTGAETFDVKIAHGSVVQRTRVVIPDDVVLHSPMTEMAVKNLQPGQQLSLKTLDPVTMETTTVVIKAVRRELLETAGESVQTTVLETELMGATTRTWIDEEGNALRQETPFGWVLEKCSIDEAFDALRSTSGGSDMLASMAVPCVGNLENPRGARSLRLRLSGVPFTEDELASNRQLVQRCEGTETELLLKAARLPPRDNPPLPDPAFDPSPYLASSTTIQTDHPEMVSAARNITKGLTNAIDKARAIYTYVHEEVDKKMTISLPSALDVLRTMRGDCNEHTYLFVGLARAAGLPAAVKVGLAYHEGGFYYHAWPAVHVGEWVETDPTWGQEGVDATHLALVEGELAQQVQLVKVMGQLRISVLEQE